MQQRHQVHDGTGKCACQSVWKNKRQLRSLPAYLHFVSKKALQALEKPQWCGAAEQSDKWLDESLKAAQQLRATHQHSERRWRSAFITAERVSEKALRGFQLWAGGAHRETPLRPPAQVKKTSRGRVALLPLWDGRDGPSRSFQVYALRSRN